MPEELQRLLPQYEITGILGRGGMGAVYSGRQSKLDRVVAIKLLPETYSKGDDELNFAARFLQEARAMARLDHPGIISVHDFGETSEGQLYFVMEYIDGMDIHQYLHAHGGIIPQESAVSIAAHVLDALDYAHSQGIVHRDIKPANIMLNRAGRVKVADFGLAKRFGEGVDAGVPALTMSNVAVGTPDFVAPEALNSNASVDHRADLYAVGIMLYQMLTGTLPRGMVRMPSELRPELDPRLDEIVGRAMEPNPDCRYSSAAAMREALDVIFTQPLGKVEPGADTGEVPAAVPLTRTVRGSSARGPGPLRAPKPTASGKGKVVLITGLVVAFGVIGLSVFRMTGPKGEIAGAPVASAGQPGTIPVTSLPTPLAKTPPTAPAETAPAEAMQPSPATVSGSPPVAKRDDAPIFPAGTSGAMPAPVPSSALHADPLPGKKAAPTPPVAAKVDPPAANPHALEALPASEPLAAEPSPHARIAALPGVKTRLEGYHAARGRQLGDLAGKYLGGVESRLNQAADAGDLKLATAFGEEKARIEDLTKTLSTPPADPLAAAADRTAPLATLPEGTPGGLIALRQTWTTESDKIRVALGTALQQSLQTLEAELTKARDFDSARAVVAYRESLSAPVEVASASANGASEAPATVASPPVTTASPTANTGSPDPVLAEATKKEPFVNSLGMKFVPVPDTDILLCIHETKKGDYAKFAAENPGVAGAWKNPMEQGVPVSEGDDHPVAQVSWNDAKAFCAWLSEKENRTYRLPTDREWSVAAGIGGDEKEGESLESLHGKLHNQYSWGTEWPPPRGSGNYPDTATKEKFPGSGVTIQEYTDGFATTAPVMSFKPNRLGLFDLCGNVTELCEDWWTSERKDKVSRGGHWAHLWFLPLSRRTIYPVGFRSNVTGFRCALVISPDNAASVDSPTAAPPAPPSAGIPAAPAPDLAATTKFLPFDF